MRPIKQVTFTVLVHQRPSWDLRRHLLVSLYVTTLFSLLLLVIQYDQLVTGKTLKFGEFKGGQGNMRELKKTGGTCKSKAKSLESLTISLLDEVEILGQSDI